MCEKGCARAIQIETFMDTVVLALKGMLTAMPECRSVAPLIKKLECAKLCFEHQNIKSEYEV
jgi:hypothetical protein